MKTWVLIIVALTVIFSACNRGMDAPPQVRVDDDFEIDVPLMPVIVQQPQPPVGIEPMIGLDPAPSSTVEVNLTLPENKISIANPSFKNGEGDDGFWKPEFDDFIVYVLTPVVPNQAFKVHWLIDGQLVEEVTMQANSQSWIIGMRWDNAQPGDHTLKVIIDPDNKVPESNEEDNEYIIGFSIPD